MSGSFFARCVNIEGWRLREMPSIHRLMRSANFTGTALLTFAIMTAIISPYHRYALYSALAGIGTAAILIGLCLAKLDRCHN
jgi:apolipoprotein N-acyltransferase